MTRNNTQPSSFRLCSNHFFSSLLFRGPYPLCFAFCWLALREASTLGCPSYRPSPWLPGHPSEEHTARASADDIIWAVSLIMASPSGWVVSCSVAHQYPNPSILPPPSPLTQLQYKTSPTVHSFFPFFEHTLGLWWLHLNHILFHFLLSLGSHATLPYAHRHQTVCIFGLACVWPVCVLIALTTPTMVDMQCLEIFFFFNSAIQSSVCSFSIA